MFNLRSYLNTFESLFESSTSNDSSLFEKMSDEE